MFEKRKENKAIKDKWIEIFWYMGFEWRFQHFVVISMIIQMILVYSTSRVSIAPDIYRYKISSRKTPIKRSTQKPTTLAYVSLLTDLLLPKLNEMSFIKHFAHSNATCMQYNRCYQRRSSVTVSDGLKTGYVSLLVFFLRKALITGSSIIVAPILAQIIVW